MEAVAFGAAIQAGVLTGEVKDIVLLDVTPLSLGIETLGGLMTKVIEKNTTIPIKKTQTFTTAEDNQPAVDIHILQGERPRSVDNVELGRFELTGIPPASRGTPQIEVTFDIDANGILHVSAKDKATGKEQRLEVVAPNKMKREDIDRMVKEAEAHAEEDKVNLENAQLRNEAESLVYTTGKTMKDYKDKVPKEIAEKVEKAKAEVEETLKGEDYAKMKTTLDSLKDAVQEIGSSMYGKGGAPGPGDKAGEAEGNPGDAGDQGTGPNV